MVDLLSLHTTLYCTASTDHLTALPLDHPSGMSIMGVVWTNNNQDCDVSRQLKITF
jgi:hypothetical protein